MNPRGYLINGNFYDENISDSKLDLVTPLYTEEPIIKELTDEEIDQVVDEVWKANPWSDVEGLDINAFARAILRKAQEK